MQNKSRMEVVPDMYVRDVPYRIIRRLCQLLDPPGPRNWEVLASMMPEYRTTEIELFRMSLMRPGGSATYEVLNDWGSRNNRVRDLVRLLVAMEHAEAANLVLKDSMPAVRDVHVPTSNQYQRQRRHVPHLEIRANGSTRKDPVPPTPPPSAFSPLNSHLSTPSLSSPPPPETVTTVCEVETEEEETKIEEEDQSDFNSLLSSGSDGGESIEEKRRKRAQAAINRLEREKLRDELASLTIGDSAATTPTKEKANAMMTRCSDSDSPQSFASSASPLSPPGSLVECPYGDVRRETDNFDSKQYNDGGHLLGSGGFGTVYHAAMWVGGELQSVAVKQLKLQLSGQEAETRDAEMRTLFRNEIQVFAKLGNGHPNLVKLLGYSVDGPEFCLIYEYVRGGSLLDRLACKGNYKPLTWTERVRVSVGSGRGLVYLHKSKHIHRDVKSANILLDSSGNAKLADFGVSKALDATTTTSVSKGKTYTQKTETIQGTRAYMAQEVFRGSLSVKVDAFAFGIVIYELITGLPPCVPKADSEEMDDLKSLVEEEEDDVEKIIDQKANWPEAVVKDLLKIADDLTEAKRKDRKEVQQILPLLEQLEHRDT